MKDEAEENVFELESLVIKPKAAGGEAAPKVTHKTSRPPKELFARITKRHRALLSTTERPATAWPLFIELMMYSVTEHGRPFPLPADDLTKDTGMSRRVQLRALRDLAKTGIVRIEGRDGRYKPPLIVIPGTTKTKHSTT